ncbi:hypothetical protein [Burkholderia ambifaria]|uniref:hypothetical protein n=1 Tax=Burkholderia ambifaria TaxID=152480 RepID=UPI001B8E588E|nr:hypothetical protein [Burkholderia ambifaria]MBR8221269.1 hypothetical protein [Burkholderia ambifaria]
MNETFAQGLIDSAFNRFKTAISSGEWTLEYAHHVLTHPDENSMNLFEIAALAKAIACFQCSDSECGED